MTALITSLAVPTLPPGRSPEASRAVVSEALAAVRAHFGMDVAFVGSFADGRRWFEYVDTGTEFCPIEVGGSDELEATYCARVVDGRIPELIPDTAMLPELADLPATADVPVGAHLSVPLRQHDGEPFGTLCCFSREPDPQLRLRDLDLLRLVADVVRGHLIYLAGHQEQFRHTLEAVVEVLNEGGPPMALQPIVDLGRDAVCGYEALARFPAHEGWTPDRWFAEADGIGLGPELEAAAVRSALRLLPLLPEDNTLSVNVSAAALCADAGISLLLCSADAPRLVVELTEHQRVARSDRLAQRLAEVRDAGVRVAVDDAGSGYAGLDHILHLRPEVLKLDRSLVQGVAEHPGRQAMCEAMVQFTRRTDAVLIAEGVETPEDLATLRALGVGHAQGYLLGRPVVRDDAGPAVR